MERERQYSEGDQHVYPIAAGEIIYMGDLVNVKDGFVVQASDTADEKYVGVADESADNTNGIDGAEEVRVRRNKKELVKCPNATASMVGKSAYIIDEDTVGVSTTNSILMGEIVEFKDAANVWVLSHQA